MRDSEAVLERDIAHIWTIRDGQWAGWRILRSRGTPPSKAAGLQRLAALATIRRQGPRGSVGEPRTDARTAATQAPPGAARGAVPGRRAGPLRGGRGEAARRPRRAGARLRLRLPRGGGRAGRSGRRSQSGCGRNRAPGGNPDGRQEPRGAPGGRRDRRRPRARPGGDRRARARLAGDPQPLRRRHRDQRQDDGDRAARAHLPHRRRAGRRRRQRRHAAGVAGRRPRPVGDRGLRMLELPARGRGGVRARVRGLPQPGARPPRPPPDSGGLPRREAADLRPAGQRGRRGLQRRRAGAWPGEDLGGCAKRVAFCHGAGPDCEVSLSGETIFHGGEPLLRREEFALLGDPTTPRTRWRPRRRRCRWGSTRARCARG